MSKNEERFTRDESDTLADIIWWIKGYQAGVHAEGGGVCPFWAPHINALRKAKRILKNHWHEEDAEQAPTKLRCNQCALVELGGRCNHAFAASGTSKLIDPPCPEFVPRK